jgi:formylglycine-generating enzyme required for sulfatase activity
MPTYEPSWYDCYYFTVFLSKARVELRDGREYRFRIPTEAQGEYASRAGSKGDYFLSDDGQEVTEETLTHYAVYRAQSPLAVDTASKRPNRWGIMHPVGNVWQWRWDYFGLYRDVYPQGKATDPTGPQTGSVRVCRGGSWSLGAAFCRSALRFWIVPSIRFSDYRGFRVALSPIGIPRQPEASSERPGNQPGASGT